MLTPQLPGLAEALALSSSVLPFPHGRALNLLLTRTLSDKESGHAAGDSLPLSEWLTASQWIAVGCIMRVSVGPRSLEQRSPLPCLRTNNLGWAVFCKE